MANVVMLTYQQTGLAEIEKQLKSIVKLSKQVKTDFNVKNKSSQSQTESGLVIPTTIGSGGATLKTLNQLQRQISSDQIKTVIDSQSVGSEIQRTNSSLSRLKNSISRTFNNVPVEKFKGMLDKARMSTTNMASTFSNLQSIILSTVASGFVFQRTQEDIVRGMKEMEIRSMFMRKTFSDSVSDMDKTAGSIEKKEVSGTKFLNQLRQASGGLVRDTVLIEEAQNALAAGLEPKHASQLIKIATALSKSQAGFASTNAVADIFTGIMRQSPRILDNLHKAFGRFGSAITDATKGLDDGKEKLLAIIEVFGNNALPIINEMGIKFGTLTDKVASLFVTIQNFGQGAVRVLKNFGIAAAAISIPAFFGAKTILGGTAGLMAPLMSMFMPSLNGIVGKVLGILGGSLSSIASIVIGLAPFMLGALGILGLRALSKPEGQTGPSVFEKFQAFTGGFLISNVDKMYESAKKFNETGKFSTNIDFYTNSLESLNEAFKNPDEVSLWISTFHRLLVGFDAFTSSFFKPIDSFLKTGLGIDFAKLLSDPKQIQEVGQRFGKSLGEITVKLAELSKVFLTLGGALAKIAPTAFEGINYVLAQIVKIGQGFGIIQTTSQDLLKENIQNAMDKNKLGIIGTSLGGIDNFIDNLFNRDVTAQKHLARINETESQARKELSKQLMDTTPFTSEVTSNLSSDLIYALTEVTKDKVVTAEETRALRELLSERFNVLEDALKELENVKLISLMPNEVR